MITIDALELNDPRDGVQCFANEAANQAKTVSPFTGVGLITATSAYLNSHYSRQGGRTTLSSTRKPELIATTDA